MGTKKKKRPVNSLERKKKPKLKSPSRSRSEERKERMKKKANQLAKQHKQKLLDAKLARQRQRNQHLMQMQRKAQMRQGEEGKQQEEEAAMAKEDKKLMAKHLGGDGCCGIFWMRLEYFLTGLLYLFTVTLRSERTFDWLIFLANNLGLYQEYEINDYGQRLSPRTGRPVLLSLGPIRVVQVVESANQVRSHWDPYIREYLRESKLTTDCWRSNRMALQVALCMDEQGNMYDMPIRRTSAEGKKA